jgi:hypothetical protein
VQRFSNTALPCTESPSPASAASFRLALLPSIDSACTSPSESFQEAKNQDMPPLQYQALHWDARRHRRAFVLRNG